MITESAVKLKQMRRQLDTMIDNAVDMQQMRKQIDALTDSVLRLSEEYMLQKHALEDKPVNINHKEYFDNSCKEEDAWGHYKTANGDLYVVIDGASSHDGSKTGGDVVRFMHKRLLQEAINIERSFHLKELIYALNNESTEANEGAYAAVAGALCRGNNIFCFGAGDVSIIAKKPNGKLLQVLPLDLSMSRDEAVILARSEIGTTIDGVEITQQNYEKRIAQYVNHGLCNAIGFGKSFHMHTKSFNARDGAAILIASDGVTDPFMEPQKSAGKINRDRTPGLYEVLNSSKNSEEAAEALKDLIWDTQVKEKRKIKADDRTGLFLYMNYSEG